MKFELDYKESFEKSLLFWLTRFVKFKLSSLSNKELKNHELFTKNVNDYIQIFITMLLLIHLMSVVKQ